MSDYKELTAEQQLIAIEKLIKLMKAMIALTNAAEEATQAFGTEWPAGERYFDEIDSNLFEHSESLADDIEKRLDYLFVYVPMSETQKLGYRRSRGMFEKSRN